MVRSQGRYEVAYTHKKKEMIVARGIVYIANDDRQRACNAIDKEFRTNERKKKNIYEFIF